MKTLVFTLLAKLHPLEGVNICLYVHFCVKFATAHAAFPKPEYTFGWTDRLIECTNCKFYMLNHGGLHYDVWKHWCRPDVLLRVCVDWGVFTYCDINLIIFVGHKHHKLCDIIIDMNKEFYTLTGGLQWHVRTLVYTYTFTCLCRLRRVYLLWYKFDHICRTQASQALRKHERRPNTLWRTTPAKRYRQLHVFLLTLKLLNFLHFTGHQD